MKRLLYTLILFLLVQWFPIPVYASTVCSSGCDYTSLDTCADAKSGGGTCTVEDNGSYSLSLSADGAAGNFIILEAGGGYSPTITSVSGIAGRDYITIDGFNITTGLSANGTVATNIKIINNAFSNVGVGISLTADYVLISDNTFNNMADDMVRQFGSYWVVRNNSMIGEIDSANEHMDQWQTWERPSGGAAAFLVFENNEYRDITGTNVHTHMANDTNDQGSGIDVTKIIVRYNKVHDIGSTGPTLNTTGSNAPTYDNTIYNNTFSELYNNSPASWQVMCCVYNQSSTSTGVNNIFNNTVYQSNVEGFEWSSGGAQSYNLYYDPDGTMTFSGLASSETGAVKNEDPLLTSPSTGDYSIPTNSPAKDAGGPLTTTVGTGSTSSTLVVVKAEFFQSGWIDGVDADYIAVGTVSNTVQISSINYGTDTITLASSISWSNGDSVWLYKDSDGTIVLIGSAPDIGAVEYGVAEEEEETPTNIIQGLTIAHRTDGMR